DVHALVCHHSSKMLPHAAPHDPRFAMMDTKPFLVQDGRNVNREPFHSALKLFPSGKRQIVGVTRVIRAPCFRKTRKPASEAVETKIGQRRRSRRALRQMPARI